MDARSPDAVAEILKATGGGAHGVLVTAVSPPAFSQALSMVRRKGTVTLVGLPPGEFPTPSSTSSSSELPVRGSIVGTRHDLDEAIAFAAAGKFSAHCETTTLERINDVLSDLKANRIDGRMVLDLGPEENRSRAPARHDQNRLRSLQDVSAGANDDGESVARFYDARPSDGVLGRRVPAEHPDPRGPE